MTDEQMRTVILTYFRRPDPHYCISGQFREALGSVAAKMGLIPTPKNSGFNGVQVVPLDGHNWTHALEVLWQMFSEGLFRPGNHDGLDSLQYFQPTQKGLQVIQNTVTPYDPDGYFARLREKAPDANEIVIAYLREALVTFKAGCTLSSAVCVGCASEAAFDEMLEAYAQTLSATDEATFRNATKTHMINVRFKAFMDEYKDKIPKLDKKLKESLETYLTGLFQVIRYQRNDSGHPKFVEMERELLHATIIAIPSQLEKMYQLIKYFRENKRK